MREVPCGSGRCIAVMLFGDFFYRRIGSALPIRITHVMRLLLPLPKNKDNARQLLELLNPSAVAVSSTAAVAAARPSNPHEQDLRASSTAAVAAARPSNPLRDTGRIGNISISLCNQLWSV